jgi:hypothetical protein
VSEIGGPLGWPYSMRQVGDTPQVSDRRTWDEGNEAMLEEIKALQTRVAQLERGLNVIANDEGGFERSRQQAKNFLYAPDTEGGP